MKLNITAFFALCSAAVLSKVSAAANLRGNKNNEVEPLDGLEEDQDGNQPMERNLVVTPQMLLQTNFYFTDKQNGKSMASGGERGVSHYDNDNSSKFKWVFEQVPGDAGKYFIKSMASGCYLLAGWNYDGRVYCQTDSVAQKRDHARWSVMGVSGNDGFFWILNKMHSRYLTAAYNYDGKMYLTPNAGDIYNHQESWWKLQAADNVGVGSGTGFNVVSEKVMSIKYLTGSTITTQPEIVDTEVLVNRSPSIEATKPVHFSKNYLASSSITIGSSTTTALEQSIRVMIGSSLYGVEFETTTTVSSETTNSQENSSTSEMTTTIATEAEIVCPPKTRCEMAFKMSVEVKDLPWEATVVRTYGDGTYDIKIVQGNWQGVLYTNKYTELNSYAI